MPNYNGLVNAMKQASMSATKADAPVTVCFGKVMNTSPLKVLVDQRMTLGAAQLVLTRNVTDYDVDVLIANENATKKMTIHNSLVKGDEVVLLRQQGGQKYIIIDRVG